MCSEHLQLAKAAAEPCDFQDGIAGGGEARDTIVDARKVRVPATGSEKVKLAAPPVEVVVRTGKLAEIAGL